MVMDDARMLARVGVFPIVSLVVTVVKDGSGRAIMTWNVGHCRFPSASRGEKKPRVLWA